MSTDWCTHIARSVSIHASGPLDGCSQQCKCVVTLDSHSWSLLVRLELWTLYHFLFLTFCVFLSLLLVLSPFFLFTLLFSHIFQSLWNSLHLNLSLRTDSPSALILLCTVLLQMRQARRLSNPCIQRYTSRIGECSSTYVSLSKSPAFQTISLLF